MVRDPRERPAIKSRRPRLIFFETVFANRSNRGKKCKGGARNPNFLLVAVIFNYRGIINIASVELNFFPSKYNKITNCAYWLSALLHLLQLFTSLTSSRAPGFPLPTFSLHLKLSVVAAHVSCHRNALPTQYLPNRSADCMTP